jgi:uracil-DNA glycosylase
VKVVILGQDPYHQPGQAMGLCFSVPPGINIPASLRNIYIELNRDLGLSIPKHGDLTKWAKQGVFLLNCILSVEAAQAASHKNIGWESFTDKVISVISEYKTGVIFLLWGNFAKSKRQLIDESKHYILEAVHPSPLAGGKFIGCGHFSKVNEILEKNGQEAIDWSL